MKVSDQVANEMLILTLLNSVSVFTNFVTRKRDKQKNKQKSHFFVYSWLARHDPCHT